MENASKALLIAASVLVAILLIAFAVKTINSTSGINESQQETMQSAEVSQFNSKFTQYVGSNKSRASAMALANAVISNNATNTQHSIILAYNGFTDAKTIVNNLGDGKYKIWIDPKWYDKDGYITNIQISNND